MPSGRRRGRGDGPPSLSAVSQPGENTLSPLHPPPGVTTGRGLQIVTDDLLAPEKLAAELCWFILGEICLLK